MATPLSNSPSVFCPPIFQDVLATCYCRQCTVQSSKHSFLNSSETAVKYSIVSVCTTVSLYFDSFASFIHKTRDIFIYLYLASTLKMARYKQTKPGGPRRQSRDSTGSGRPASLAEAAQRGLPRPAPAKRRKRKFRPGMF